MDDICGLLIVLILFFFICQYNNSMFEGFIESFENDTNVQIQQQQQQQRTQQQQLQQQQQQVYAYDNLNGYSPINFESDQVPKSMQSSYPLVKNKRAINEVSKFPDVNNIQFDSQLRTSDPSSKGGLLSNQMLKTTITDTKTGNLMRELPLSDQKSVEIHMVYGDWCGHSKKAKPAFQNLLSRNDLKTSDGTPISFKMTTDKSNDYQTLFKNDVNSFPTYMSVVKDNGNNPENFVIKELKTLGRDAESIIKAATSL